jgi:hypothetical protein
MINLENLADMSYRHQQGMLALTDDIDERNYITSMPFGGVLFTGDLHQLRPIKTAKRVRVNQTAKKVR